MGDENELTAIVKAGAGAVSEVAKAEQEHQRTYQSALDLVKRAGDYLGGVFGPASNELSLLFGQQMKFWRFKNAVNVLEKTQALIEQRGLRPEQVKALGFGEGLLLLEAASLEEDDVVQNMWARLVANAVDPKSGNKTEKVFIDILKSLSNREVIFLDLLWQIHDRTGSRTAAEYEKSRAHIGAQADAKWRSLTAEERGISVQNLVRLRCITFSEESIDLQEIFALVPSEYPFQGGRKWAFVDPRKLENVLRQLAQRHLFSSGLKDFPDAGRFTGYPGYFPEANFVLTPLGEGLRRACALDAADASSEE